MAELRILTVGDIHLSDQSPGKRTETYGEDILAKVEQIAQIARKEKATHLLLLGDVFDNKNAHRISHRLVQRVGSLLMGAGMPVLVLVGNHDISSGTLESIPKQPIGVLGLLPGVELLTWDTHYLADDVALFPVPGVPLDEDWRECFETRRTDDMDLLKRRIIVAHQLIVPDVTHFPEAARRNFYDANEVGAATDADMVLYGDIHTNHGAYKAHGTLFANFGSICRMSVGDVDHKPEVVMYVIADNEERNVSMKRFPLTIRPVDEVYRLEEHVEAKEHQADIDDTIARLKATTIHKFSIEAVMESITQNETADDGVRDMAIELIEATK